MNIYWKQTLKTANILARYSHDDHDATGHFRFHRSNNIYYIILYYTIYIYYVLYIYMCVYI